MAQNNPKMTFNPKLDEFTYVYVPSYIKVCGRSDHIFQNFNLERK